MDQAAEIIESPQSPTSIDTGTPPVTPKSRAKIAFSIEDSVQLNELPFVVMLFLSVFIFGAAVLPLGMLTYDYQGLLAAEQGSFFSYLTQIVSATGLLHPLGILFNSAMYLISTQSFAWAHLFVYAAHAFTGVLLAVMISRKYTRLESALFGILFLALPLFTGQYGWLAQGNLSVALFVLILQLLIVQSTHLDIVVKSAFLVILQIIAVLLHESMLFSIIPIILFLLPTERPYFAGVHLRTLLVLCVPSALYLILKIFVIQPHSLVHFVQNEVWQGFSSFFATITAFFRPGEYFGFWSHAFSDGVTVITHSDIILLFSAVLIGLLIYEFALFFTHRFADGKVSSPLVNPLFWLIMGVCTCVPYNSAALGFPLFCFLVAGLQLIRLFSRRVGIGIACIILFISIPVSLGLLDQMKTRAANDAIHFKQIITPVESAVKEKETTAVIIENPPSNQSGLSFADYMKPCIALPACLDPALKLHSKKITSTFTGSLPQGFVQRVIPFTYIPDHDELIPKL